jgi:predicted Zn-dependent protease with MMP-like domain
MHVSMSAHERGRSPYQRRLAQHSGANLTVAEFEQVVEEALASLPDQFVELIRNVVVAVEDEPNEEDLEANGGDEAELLGIYRGVALTERGGADPMLPDEIAIFRGPITRIARSRREAIREVRETVMHELGHYFGLEDEDLPY